MKNRLLFLIVMSFCTLGAVAQDNMTQQAVGLVQSLNVNPAARPNRGFISIPIFGSFQVGVSNSFSYADVISVRPNAKYIDLPSLISTSRANGNSLLTNFNLDILNLGFYVTPEDFITISLRARAHAGTNFPLGLFEMISDNALNQPHSFDVNMNPNVLAWGEFGVGYSRSIGNFTVGARFKYIEGIASASTATGVNFLVDKQYDKYMISADYAFNTAGLSIGQNNAMSFAYTPFSNPGFAVDLGATWLSDDERISASVSVSDLGKIWWNANASTELRVRNPNEKFEYNGLGDLLNKGLDFGKLLDSVVTQFNKVVGVDTLKGAAFASSMPVTFQAMGSYSLGRNLQHNVSLGFIGSLPYRGGFDYAISAGYAYRSPNKVWQLMANYTYRKSNPLNIGFGVVMTTGCFQLYLACDNVITPLDLSHARNANFRLGLNFFFGPESVKN